MRNRSLEPVISRLSLAMTRGVDATDLGSGAYIGRRDQQSTVARKREKEKEVTLASHASEPLSSLPGQAHKALWCVTSDYVCGCSRAETANKQYIQ